MRRGWTAPLLWAGIGLGCSSPTPPPADGSTGTTDGSSSSSSAATELDSSSTVVDSDDSGSGEPDPEGPGTCAAMCTSPDDCTLAGGGRMDWECNAGFCELAGFDPCDPLTCNVPGIGVCADVAGVSTCTFPCTPDGSDCRSPAEECTGMDDLGTPICAPLPCGGVAEGEPCVTPAGDASGTCIDDQCICMVDEECTAGGHACNHG